MAVAGEGVFFLDVGFAGAFSGPTVLAAKAKNLEASANKFFLIPEGTAVERRAEGESCRDRTSTDVLSGKISWLVHLWQTACESVHREFFYLAS